MPWPSLVLWMSLYPLAAVFGLALALATYFALRPRERPGWAEVPAEGWRALAVLAAVPAFFLGAELALWGGLLAWRAPLAHTAFLDRLGWTAAVAAPLPVVAYLVWERRPLRAPLRLSAAVAALAALLVVVPPVLRSRAVATVTAAAPADAAAFERLMLLVGYRYVPAEAALPALDAALPRAADALAYALAARDGGTVPFTAEVRAHLAARLFASLEADPAELGDAAVPAIEWLSGAGDDVLRAFALAAPELHAAALRGDVDPQEALRVALGGASEEARAAVLRAAYAATDRVPLRAGLIEALAASLDASEPVGPLATRMLLRDASSAALRNVVARFNDPEAPEWRLLRSDCPRQTVGLDRLEHDPDADVARGAAALRGYVRQYCRLASRTQG